MTVKLNLGFVRLSCLLLSSAVALLSLTIELWTCVLSPLLARGGKLQVSRTKRRTFFVKKCSQHGERCRVPITAKNSEKNVREDDETYNKSQSTAERMLVAWQTDIHWIPSKVTSNHWILFWITPNSPWQATAEDFQMFIANACILGHAFEFSVNRSVWNCSTNTYPFFTMSALMNQNKGALASLLPWRWESEN